MIVLMTIFFLSLLVSSNCGIFSCLFLCFPFKFITNDTFVFYMFFEIINIIHSTLIQKSRRKFLPEIKKFLQKTCESLIFNFNPFFLNLILMGERVCRAKNCPIIEFQRLCGETLHAKNCLCRSLF